MSQFDFVGGSYTLSSPHADIQASINLYPEIIESGWGKGQAILLPTPGASLFCSSPIAAAGRGLFTFQGRTFGVAGTDFFEVTPTGAINVNFVNNDGNPASFAANPSGQLMIASGGTLYLFNMNSNVMTNITVSQQLLPITQVVYTDAFFLAVQANSNVFYISNLEDGTTWQLGNASAVSVFPDNVVALVADHREPWLLGQKESQVYYDSGAANTPYIPINGAFLEEGCIATFSAVRLDNSIFWLGGNVDRGQGIVWRANGYTPTRVSNHAIEFAIQGYSKISDAIAYGYQENGHSFYVLYFPTANVTWVYDVASQLWHQRGYFSGGVYTAHRSMAHTVNFGVHLVMDPVNGNVNQQSVKLLQEADGTLIRRLRRAPHISTEQEWVYHYSLQIDLETGLGTFNGGTTFPTTVVLKDSSGQLWNIQVTDSGLFQQSKTFTGATPNVIQLNDSNGNSWQIGVNTIGQLIAIPIAQGSFPPNFPMGSLTGQLVWFIQVALPGNPQSATGPVVARGPQCSLRYSDDGGHTWSNYRIADCGQLGQWKARVVFRRLGRSRDRVYEISMSDPIYWSVVNAYLKALPGFGPQERLPKQLGKVA